MSGPSILVVANPAEAERIALWLGAAKVGAVRTGNGSDETLTDLAASPPDVVVLSVGLRTGDALAFAHAMRAALGPTRGCALVLIGEEKGPVRTALDAIEFHADRFLRRPVAKSALLFAVRSCVDLGSAGIVAAVSQETAPAPPTMDAGGMAGFLGIGGPGAGIGVGIGLGGVSGGSTALALAATLLDTTAATRPARAADVSSDVAIHALVHRLDEATSEAIDAFLHDLSESTLSGPALDLDGYEEELRSSSPVPPVDQVAPGEARRGPPDEGRSPLNDGARRGPPDEGRSPLNDGARRGPPDEGRSPLPGEARRGLPDEGRSPLNDIAPPWREPTQILAPARPQPPPPPPARARSSSTPTNPVAIAPEEAHTGTFVSELKKHMSAVEARLFGDSGGEATPDDDPASSPEIDLDAIGMPTIPGMHEDEPRTPRPPGRGRTEEMALDDEAAAGSNGAQTTGSGAGHTAAGASSSAAGGTGPGIGAGNGARRAASSRDPLTPALRGDLREDDVAFLLARLHREAFAGRVSFRRGEAKKAIFFEEGRPVFATSNLPHDRMGDLLYREGKITREQHAKSREIVAETGRRMGEILVEMGFLKRRELLPAVRRHVEDIVYSLFSWDTGTYATSPGDGAKDEKIRLAAHPTALVLEGIRRKMGLERLRVRLGGTTSVIAPLKRDEIVQALADGDLSPEERKAADLFDGRRSLGEILATPGLGLDESALFQLAHGLAALGLVRVIDRGREITDSGRQTTGVSSPPTSITGAADLAIDRERVLAKHAHVLEADYFVILGVRRDATSFEIRRAYEAARRDYATESFPKEVQRDLATELGEIAVVLDEAQRILRSDGVRAQYLANLKD